MAETVHTYRENTQNNKKFGYYLLGLLVLIVLVLIFLFSATKDEALGDEVTFSSNEKGFSIEYPKGFGVNESYRYTGLGAGSEIEGVSFTVPEEMSNGTTLSSDTYLSVEKLAYVPSACTPDLFMDNVMQTSTLDDDGKHYDVALGGDAGAGNFYQNIVFSIPGSSPCTAVRYLIHSTNINNYEPGTVEEFDSPSLLRVFDEMRRSLTLNS